MISTSDLFAFDTCSRKGVWGMKWETPRMSIHEALAQSLRIGLLAKDNPAQAGKNAFMRFASNPGLSLSYPRIYDISIHHSHLIEVLIEYLRGSEPPWEPHPPVKVGQHLFSPNAFLMPDGRLRRVILAGYWDSTRQEEESHSWRTVADLAATGRPMLINAIVIGAMKDGFRQTPWSRGFEHPKTREFRTCRLEGKPFAESWKKQFRESTNISAKEWLRIMQRDGAFGKLVHSFNCRDAEIGELEEHLDLMKSAPENPPMRRAACFANGACGFTGVCYATREMTPGLAMWKEKPPPEGMGV